MDNHQIFISTISYAMGLIIGFFIVEEWWAIPVGVVAYFIMLKILNKLNDTFLDNGD